MLAGWVENTVRLEVRCWLAIAPSRKDSACGFGASAAPWITIDSMLGN
jgi:hypothetical protein